MSDCQTTLSTAMMRTVPGMFVEATCTFRRIQYTQAARRQSNYFWLDPGLMRNRSSDEIIIATHTAMVLLRTALCE